MFLKPPPGAKQFLGELNSLLDQSRGRGVDLSGRLDAVALVMEDLLVDTDGRVEPSPLVFDVQIRRFLKDADGKLQEPEAAQYELSRKLLVTQPSSGGLVRFGEDDPAYLPMAMNDYSFATPQFGLESPIPILSTLQRRCQSCHSKDLSRMETFPPMQDANALFSPLPVRQLDPATDVHGAYVAEQKMKRPGFVGMLHRR